MVQDRAREGAGSSPGQAVENREDFSPFQAKIEMELRQLGEYVSALNEDFWPAIADPERCQAM